MPLKPQSIYAPAAATADHLHVLRRQQGSDGSLLRQRPASGRDKAGRRHLAVAQQPLDTMARGRWKSAVAFVGRCTAEIIEAVGQDAHFDAGAGFAGCLAESLAHLARRCAAGTDCAVRADERRQVTEERR